MNPRSLLLLAVPVLAAPLGCTNVAARPKRGATVERLPRFEVVQPQRKRLIRKLELAATVEALKKVDLSARVPGVVDVLDDKMDIGREVKKGEVLLVLGVPDLDADLAHKKALTKQAEKQKVSAYEALKVAREEVEEAKKLDQKYRADVDYARKRLTRITRLVQQRAQEPLSQEEAEQQLESARATLAANKARIARQVARVLAAEADHDLAAQRIKVAEAEVQKLKEMIRFATVPAPFDGVITRRWVDPGAIIKDPGAILLTVMEMKRVRVLIDVPQRDVANLNAREQNPNPDGKGDPVTVTIPALAELSNHGKFDGNVTRVSRSLDPVTRTMRAEIELDNPELHLRPGMFGTASVAVEDRSNVMTLPATALVRRGEGLVEVYYIADLVPTGHADERRGILRRKPVVLGIDDGKEVEIRDGSLRGDELVVARSTGVIRADEPVIAVTERDTQKE
jgi:RND family efflux transporter MFP subunit